MSIDNQFSYLQDRVGNIELTYLPALQAKLAKTPDETSHLLLELVEQIRAADTNADTYLDASEREQFNRTRKLKSQISFGEQEWRNFRRQMFKYLSAEQRIASLNANRLINYLQVYNEGLKFSQLLAAGDFTPLKSSLNILGLSSWGDNLASESAKTYFNERQQFLKDFQLCLAQGILANQSAALKLDVNWVLQQMPATYAADQTASFAAELNLFAIADALNAATPFERTQKMLQLADNEIADGNADVDNYFQLFQNNHNNGFARTVYSEISSEGLFEALANYAQISLNKINSENNGNYTLEESQAQASRIAEAGVELLVWRYLPGAIWRRTRPVIRGGASWLASRRIAIISSRAESLLARFAATDARVAALALSRRHPFFTAVRSWFFPALFTGVHYATVSEQAMHPEAAASCFLGSMINYENVAANAVLNSDILFLSRMEPWASAMQDLPRMSFTINKNNITIDPSRLFLQHCSDTLCSDATKVHSYETVLNKLSCEDNICEAVVEKAAGTYRLAYWVEAGLALVSNPFNYQIAAKGTAAYSLNISAENEADSDGNAIPKLVVQTK